MKQQLVVVLGVLVAIATVVFACGHDELIRLNLLPEIQIAQQSSVPAQHFETKAPPSVMRIVFDTRYILGDIQKTCYQEGATVPIGTPLNNNTFCSDTVVTNCWVTCTANQVVTSALAANLPALLDAVKTTITDLLTLQQSSGTLTVDTCGEIPIPAEHKNPGVDADLLVYVIARPTASNIIASAAACAVDPNAGHRPIIGFMNLSPQILNETVYAFSSAKSILLHEFIHILGFSSTLYPFYVPGNPVHTSTVTFQGSSKTLYVTNGTSVVSVAKTHFNCSNLMEVNLEEAGGSGTRGSHWERTRLANELMIGTYGWDNPSNGPALSAFTLAMLEDSGWYIPNYELADPMEWGRGAGCNFATQRCEIWNTDLTGYFCTEDLFTGVAPVKCLYHLKGKGICDLSSERFVSDPYYNHFGPTTNAYGGDAYMDFCPVVRKFDTMLDITGQLTDSCAVAPSSPTSYEYFSATDSGCFTANFVPTGISPFLETSNARCLQYKCTANSVLQIGNGGYYINCPSTQEKAMFYLNLNTTVGFVECPAKGFDILCTGQPIVAPGPVLPPTAFTSNFPIAFTSKSPISQGVTVHSSFIVVLVAMLCVAIIVF